MKDIRHIVLVFILAIGAGVLSSLLAQQAPPAPVTRPMKLTIDDSWDSFILAKRLRGGMVKDTLIRNPEPELWGLAIQQFIYKRNGTWIDASPAQNVGQDFIEFLLGDRDVTMGPAEILKLQDGRKLQGQIK